MQNSVRYFSFFVFIFLCSSLGLALTIGPSGRPICLTTLPTRQQILLPCSCSMPYTSSEFDATSQRWTLVLSSHLVPGICSLSPAVMPVCSFVAVVFGRYRFVLVFVCRGRPFEFGCLVQCSGQGAVYHNRASVVVFGLGPSPRVDALY